MSELAILGHPTRGKEVIEILEMLGGINAIEHCGNNDNIAYYIKETYKNWIDTGNLNNLDDFIILTLEGFLKKYPYKVGDKVCFSDNPHHYLTIMEIWWNDDCSDLECTFYEDNIDVSVSDLQPYKEETMEETKKNLDWHPTDYLEFVDNDEWADEVELNLGDSYEIQVRGGQTFAIKKQPQYPKTCEECLKILGKTMNSLDNMRGYKYALFMRLQQLLISRDAYWKIAEDWKPILGENFIYAIGTCYGAVEKRMVAGSSGILLFPTEEMRDAFYENFKELIEQCKELL